MKQKTCKTSCTQSKNDKCNLDYSIKKAKFILKQKSEVPQKSCEPVVDSSPKQEDCPFGILCMMGGTVLFIALTLLLVFIISGCTYSINMAHTRGHASDVIDETDDMTPTVSPTVELPLRAI